jgi:hypothetical protein
MGALHSCCFSKIARVSKYDLFGEQIAFVFQFSTKLFLCCCDSKFVCYLKCQIFTAML